MYINVYIMYNVDNKYYGMSYSEPQSLGYKIYYIYSNTILSIYI